MHETQSVICIYMHMYLVLSLSHSKLGMQWDTRYPHSVTYMYYVCPSDNQLASGPVFRPLDHFLQSLDCIVWKTTPGVIFQSNINYCNLINYNWSWNWNCHNFYNSILILINSFIHRKSKFSFKSSNVNYFLKLT